MIVRFITKDAHVPQNVLDTMEKRLLQRLGVYYRGEEEDASTIVVKITERKGVYKVEITMPYGGHQMRTENEERDLSLPALDKGIDILERQIKKLKTRLNRRLREVPELAPEADEPEDAFAVVKVKRYENKPMTVQDAILEMNLLGHAFFTSFNADSKQVCTVYRRNDGDYGLIEIG